MTITSARRKRPLEHSTPAVDEQTCTRTLWTLHDMDSSACDWVASDILPRHVPLISVTCRAFSHTPWERTVFGTQSS